MELSNFPLKNFEPYTSKTKKAIKKNTNLVEITHYVCQSIVFAELSGRPYTRLGAVHKLRLQEEGGRLSKKSTFCQNLYHTKCQRRGVGGQKSQIL